jgi:hypothetical protein
MSGEAIQCVLELMARGQAMLLGDLIAVGGRL